MTDTATLRAAGGARLAYVRHHGHAPGVVFLGGFKSDMTGSKALALDAWCRERGIAFLRFDYYGHGASDGRFEDGTIGRWSEDTLAMLDQATAGPQVLVGSSMGGWIMLLAALARPERVAGLAGVASAADFTEDLVWGSMDASARETLRREGVIQPPAENGEEEPAPITLRLIEEARSHLLLRTPLAIDCPVRLLHGMQDRDVPWQTSVRIAERVAAGDVRVTLVKDGEHRLSRPEDLALLVANVEGLRARA